jgi:HPt (histidine-containing phosphotransfer) domain-containing protein
MGSGSTDMEALTEDSSSNTIVKTSKSRAVTIKSKSNVVPIDVSVIREIFGDDKGEFKEVLDSFVEPSQHIIDDLKLSYQAQSFDDVKAAAHKLKSSARSIGADELAETCAALESAGEENDLKTIEQLVPTLDPAFDKIKLYIASLN